MAHCRKGWGEYEGRRINHSLCSNVLEIYFTVKGDIGAIVLKAYQNIRTNFTICDLVVGSFRENYVNSHELACPNIVSDWKNGNGV